jgi:hypothetical protein
MKRIDDGVATAQLRFVEGTQAQKSRLLFGSRLRW